MCIPHPTNVYTRRKKNNAEERTSCSHIYIHEKKSREERMGDAKPKRQLAAMKHPLFIISDYCFFRVYAKR